MRNRNLNFLVIGLAVLVFLVIATSGILVSSIKNLESDDNVVRVVIMRWTHASAYEDNINAFKDAFTQRTDELGLTVEFHEPAAANSNEEIYRESLQSILQISPDLIYTTTTPGTLVAKELTSTTPIIFSIVTYPVEAGLIASNRSSGNNLVGTRNWVPVRQQLDNFLLLTPNVKRLGFVRRDSEPNSQLQLAEMELAAAARDIEIVDIKAPNLMELEEALAAATGSVDAIFSACDTLVQEQSDLGILVEFVRVNRLPDFACIESEVAQGAMMATVANFAEIGKIAGEKAFAVLTGTPPSELNTTTAPRPYVYVNRERVEELGLPIPQELYIIATEIL